MRELLEAAVAHRHVSAWQEEDVLGGSHADDTGLVVIDLSLIIVWVLDGPIIGWVLRRHSRIIVWVLDGPIIG